MTCDEIEPSKELIAFGKKFQIKGVDKFTQDFYLQRYHRHFPLSNIEKPKGRDAVVV